MEATAKPFSIIVAISHSDRAIGVGGRLPWHIPGDLAAFAKTTKGAPPEGKINAVIMGRRTFDSLPARVRPLPGRLNVVLSRQRSQADFPENVLCFRSLEDALLNLSARDDVNDIFVAGGESVYVDALAHPKCAALYITYVFMHPLGIPGANAFFPDIDPDVWKTEKTQPRSDGAKSKPEGVVYLVQVHKRE